MARRRKRKRIMQSAANHRGVNLASVVILDGRLLATGRGGELVQWHRDRWVRLVRTNEIIRLDTPPAPLAAAATLPTAAAPALAEG